MNKEQMIQIAERNLRKSKMALSNNSNRKGITEQEIKNLTNNVEYAQTVYDLIVNNMEG
jgi:hypothetical protein